MKRYTSAGAIFFMLLFDCVLMNTLDMNVITVGFGDVFELNCTAEEVLLTSNIKYNDTDIEQIVLSRLADVNKSAEPLAELTKEKIARSSIMVPKVWINKGWNFSFGQYKIRAQYIHSTVRINGLYACTVTVKHDGQVLKFNTTMMFEVALSEPMDYQLGVHLPIEVLGYVNEVLIILIALTTFCCIFVLICCCTEERSTVAEKFHKLNKWKTRRKMRKMAMSRKISLRSPSSRVTVNKLRESNV